MGSHDDLLLSPWGLWRDARTIRLWADRITTYPLQPNAGHEPLRKREQSGRWRQSAPCLGSAVTRSVNGPGTVICCTRMSQGMADPSALRALLRPPP